MKTYNVYSCPKSYGIIFPEVLDTEVNLDNCRVYQSSKCKAVTFVIEKLNNKTYRVVMIDRFGDMLVNKPTFNSLKKVYDKIKSTIDAITNL